MWGNKKVKKKTGAHRVWDCHRHRLSGSTICTKYLAERIWPGCTLKADDLNGAALPATPYSREYFLARLSATPCKHADARRSMTCLAREKAKNVCIVPYIQVATQALIVVAEEVPSSFLPSSQDDDIHRGAKFHPDEYLRHVFTLLVVP